MDIVVKGRQTEVSDRFRQHAMDKLERIERFDQKLIRVDVELSRERNPRQQDVCERIELTCHSRGPVIRAEAAADDKYAALDLAYDKLQMRLRRLADRRRVHHGRKSPISLAASEISGARTGLLTAPSEADPAESEVSASVGIGAEEAFGVIDGEGPFLVREKVHVAAPKTIDEALFEMELVGHDFFLFTDRESGLPSVVYRRRGYDYGVIRVKPIPAE